MIEFVITEINGRTYMRSVREQTAEQVVDELNLFGELDLPLFSYELQGGSNDQSKMPKMQENQISDQALKDRPSSATIQTDMPGMS